MAETRFIQSGLKVIKAFLKYNFPAHPRESSVHPRAGYQVPAIVTEFQVGKNVVGMINYLHHLHILQRMMAMSLVPLYRP